MARKEEVATYGLIPVPWDDDRTVMKLNFFGEPLTLPWRTEAEAAAAEEALEQLLAGKEIIKEVMANETARYTTAFRDVDLVLEQSAIGDVGAQTRYCRAILAYRSALAAAGLEPPAWTPSIRKRRSKARCFRRN